MSYGPTSPNLARIRQCLADDGKGNVCGLEAGHAGKHGYERPEAEDYAHRDRQRSYFKRWKAPERN